MVRESRRHKVTQSIVTAQLAERFLGWRTACGRFLKPDGGWIPEWRFRPFESAAHALELLNHADQYQIVRDADRSYTVRVRVGRHLGTAVGPELANTVSVAAARAVGIQVPA